MESSALSEKTYNMVFGTFVQPSNVLSQNRYNIAHTLSPDTSDTTILPIDLHWGVHIASCGHAMHYECLNGYLDFIIQRSSIKRKR